MLSHASPVTHGSQKCETSMASGSATSPSMAEEKKEILNIQTGSLDQQNERCGLVKKGKEMAVRYWETGPVISCCRKQGEGSCESLDERMKQTAANKARMTPSNHLSRTDRIENEIVKQKFSSSQQKKSFQTVCIKAGLESAGNDLLINSDSKENKVVSSIKTPVERPNKSLHQRNSTECSAYMKVSATEWVYFGRPKQLQHKPTGLTEAPSSDTIQSIENYQMNEDTNVRPIPENTSSSQEVVMLHGTKKLFDKPQEKTEISDLPSNEQNCLNIVEMRQKKKSCVSFREMYSGMNLEEEEISVSKTDLSFIRGSHEGNLVSDINVSASNKSKTSLHLSQEKNECSAAKIAAQSISSTEDLEQTAKSDTSSCGLNIKKRGATISDVRIESSNFAFNKTHGAVSRAGSKLVAQKSTEKCVQELRVERKPHHAGLDPAELQQIVHDWDSDIEGDRNDEFSQGSKPLYKDVMPQDDEVIKNPSTVKIQQHVKEKDIHAVHDNQEHSLYDKASGTKEKDEESTMSAESQKHSESPLLSHAISVELQKLDENISTSKNKGYEVNKNSESKNKLTASSVHEMDVTKNVKSQKLKSRFSSADRDNFQQIESLRVTNNVPSSEALVQQSRGLERNSDCFKTSSRKRRLYSSADTPEVIEFIDYDDISRTCNILFTPSSRGTKKMIFTNRISNVNKKPIKKLQDDNRERRRTESIPACQVKDQLGVTVARFGELSETAKLDVSKPRHFSKKSLSGRWRNKYLEEVSKCKLEKKCKVNVRRSVNSSVYSEFDETDSDNDPSSLEPEKLFFPHSSRGTKKMILTNRESNVNKTTIKKFQDDNRERRKTEPVSAYSDTVETDSDSVLSWLEPGKPKGLLVCQKPKMTYEKRRTTFRSKLRKKETIVTKHRKISKSKTNMNLTSEGSCTHGDGMTMTVKGMTEADGK